MYREEHQADINRAIRRSRNARAALDKPRRWALVVASISIAIASGTFFAVTGVTGSEVVDAAAAQAKSLADLLDARSPGARTDAQLTKTKHAKAMAKQRMAPRQRPVPPKVDIVKIAQLLGPSPSPSTSTPFAPVVVGMDVSVPDLTTPPPSLGLIVGPPGGGGVVVPPPSGGGGPVTFPTPQPTEVVPPALPEPGTWATMLLGFGFVGWRIRRSNAQALLQSAQSVSSD